MKFLLFKGSVQCYRYKTTPKIMVLSNSDTVAVRTSVSRDYVLSHQRSVSHKGKTLTLSGYDLLGKGHSFLDLISFLFSANLLQASP